MSTELDEHLELDRKKVINAVKLQTPLEVVTYTLPRNMDAYLHSVEDVFLEECHQEHLKEYLNFCLGELLANSKKANTKRVYFKEKNLDINDPVDYAAGMEHFKDDTFGDIDYYMELQKKAGLYIKLCMQFRGDTVLIQIKNNSVLTPIEKERINFKFATAQQYDNMDEVVSNVLDQSEGAGLGIIIIILMLQKVGFSKDNFSIYSTDEETITQIILPCNKKIYAAVDIISYEFVNMQTKVPVLQGSFDKINKLIQASSIKRDKVMDCLRKDALLSLVAIKYAREKDADCFSLPGALELLSDEELKFVYSDCNPKLDIIPENEELEAQLNHAYIVAFHAYNLCKNHPDFGIDPEYMYALGLLNNIGNILLKATNEEQKNYIKDLSSQYEGLSEKIQDMFKLGYASNYLNMIYGKKIGFPEDILGIFYKWNCIENNDDSVKSIVKILYLAEMLQYYTEDKVSFYQLDKAILKEFEITNEEQFKYVLQKMKEKL